MNNYVLENNTERKKLTIAKPPCSGWQRRGMQHHLEKATHCQFFLQSSCRSPQNGHRRVGLRPGEMNVHIFTPSNLALTNILTDT